MNQPNPTPVESTLNIENVTVLSTKRPRNLKKTIFKSLAVAAVLGAGTYIIVNRTVDPSEVTDAVSAALPE